MATISISPNNDREESNKPMREQLWSCTLTVKAKTEDEAHRVYDSISNHITNSHDNIFDMLCPYIYEDDNGSWVYTDDLYGRQIDFWDKKEFMKYVKHYYKQAKQEYRNSLKG